MTQACAIALMRAKGRRLGRLIGLVGLLTASLARGAEDPLVLTWMGPPRHDPAQEGSWKERWLERQFGIELKPVFIGWNAYEKRKPLMMMGGDIPDVFWETDAVGVKQDARNGFACELPLEVIVRHAPDYVRIVTHLAPEAWLMSRFEGRNYGLPVFGLQGNSVRPLPGVWRMDWLRKLGFDRPPETLEEMHRALRAFRHEDPDGNGRQDTYGFLPDAKFELCFGEIYGAYGLMPAGWLERDGRLVWSATLPATKTVLSQLRQWYAEGLIYPDYFLTGRSSNERVQLFARGKIGYLPDYARYDALDPRFDGSIAGLFLRLHPGVELVPGAFPEGPAGRRGAPISGAGQGVILFGHNLEREPEKVRRVLEMFNALVCNREMYLQARFGQQGRHWVWQPEHGLVTLPPFDRGLTGGAELVGPNPSIETSGDFYCPFSAPPAWVAELITAAERAFDDRWRSPQWAIKAVLPRSDLIDGAETCYRDLQRLQETVFTEIITGKRDLEEFEAFAQEWWRRGGELLTRNANRQRAQIEEIKWELAKLEDTAKDAGREIGGAP